MGVSNVSACMGGLANEMESCSSSERVQAGVGHQIRAEGTRFQSRMVLTKKENLTCLEPVEADFIDTGLGIV